MELIRQFSSVATYRSRLHQKKKELRRQIEELETDEAMLDHLLGLLAEGERLASTVGGERESTSVAQRPAKKPNLRRQSQLPT